MNSFIKVKEADILSASAACSGYLSITIYRDIDDVIAFIFDTDAVAVSVFSPEAVAVPSDISVKASRYAFLYVAAVLLL